MAKKKKDLLEGSVPGHAARQVDQEDHDFLVRPVFDADGVQTSPGIGRDGREYGDPVPMDVPLGMGPSDFDPIRVMIENLVHGAIEAKVHAHTDEQWDTEDEANDFEVDEEPPDPETPYEAVFNMPVSSDVKPPVNTGPPSKIDATTTRIVSSGRPSTEDVSPGPGSTSPSSGSGTEDKSVPPVPVVEG